MARVLGRRLTSSPTHKETYCKTTLIVIEDCLGGQYPIALHISITYLSRMCLPFFLPRSVPPWVFCTYPASKTP
jgi:hypothetical protein